MNDPDMSGHIVVLTAIDTELNKARAPEGVEVIYTGVGKVNAASIATLAVMALQPKLIVNYGTAGKIAHIHNGLVEVAHTVQRDMAAMPLAPRGRTPFAPEMDRLSSGHGSVVCGTGDSFVTSVDPWLVENNIDIVDMELFAIAHVCQRHNVPWRAFKFITDAADENAADHWNENVAGGEDLFWDVMKDIAQ
ncbi:MAG: S-adenosylhomocysteine nucleosidase [Afipia sp.]|jgi:adenosylhomocysteine nucleosidase|nr:MAG: S-adenosylhomocysteine nucleosidase [Afipia sp.]